jgi:Uma2 family endonuclease
MNVAVKCFGPADHGRRVPYDAFMTAEYEPGYTYEIIDGRLYVAPQPNFPEHRLERWIDRKLSGYAEDRPDVINFVATKGPIFVPGRPAPTVPEPDVAAFRDVPLDTDLEDIQWEDLTPVLAVEVLVKADPEKDLVRNVELYLQVPSIREYWVIDARRSTRRPTLIVFRRRGPTWLKPREIAFGGTSTTPLLPGFRLVVDPRS